MLPELSSQVVLILDAWCVTDNEQPSIHSIHISVQLHHQTTAPDKLSGIRGTLWEIYSNYLHQ